MSEWKEYQLGEIATIVDCEHKTAPIIEFSDFISVRTADIANGKIKYDQANRISEETYIEWTNRIIPQEGDIILAREAPVGEVGWIEKGRKICLGQRTVLLRTNSSTISPKYLLYYLVNNDSKLDLISQSTGSVVEHLNVKNIREFHLKVHNSIQQQEEIASVLSCLDDKIDLLHHQNKTLEKLAEILFRQWFNEKANESRELRTIEEVCLTIASGGTPSTRIDEYYNGNINWYSTKELNDNFLFESTSKITEIGLKYSSAKLFPENTIVIAIYAAPTVGRLGILASEASFNQAACGFIVDEEKICFEYLYLYLLSARQTLNDMASGSAQQNLNVSIMREFPINCPTSKIMVEFRNIVRPMFKKIKDNSKQIRTLTQLRDKLLPKLMSGEVRVK